MKNPLKALMSHSGGTEGTLAESPEVARPPTMAALLATVRRVEADDNSFGIPVLDCREFATKLLGRSAELIAPETAILAPSQRESLPDEAVSLDCRLTYPLGQEPPEGLLFRARTMQDKWHIFRYGSRLFFTRSWTGDPLFVAEFEMAPRLLTVTRIHADPGVFADGSALAVGIVDFLIKSHLFRVAVPHPLPAELPDVAPLVATWSFNHLGRWGHFATWEDVTRLQLMAMGRGLALRWIQ